MQDMIEPFTVISTGKKSPTLGQIMTYTGDNIPDGWLPCDRRMLRRHRYPDLFRVLGIHYGDGDGSNTAFNLPGKVSEESSIRYIIFVGMANK